MFSVRYESGFEGGSASNPLYFRTEERNIVFPKEGRLEIGIFDKRSSGADAFVGSTVIDLERRWFNDTFQRYMKKRSAPIEYRPLVTTTGRKQRKGNLEMWIEMMDAESAGDFPATPLVPPML